MARARPTYLASDHAIQRYMERFSCPSPHKAQEILKRRARRARPLPPAARAYARGEALLLRHGSLVLVLDPKNHVIVTCYPYAGGAQ